LDQVEQKFILKLGKRIAQLRREQRYTQVELSSRINMEEAALRRVELGGTNPTVKTLLKIASGLERPY
jgi:transcriptional regulator with XRE-family HTH domain